MHDRRFLWLIDDMRHIRFDIRTPLPGTEKAQVSDSAGDEILESIRRETSEPGKHRC
jgi:hypothetical protein